MDKPTLQDVLIAQKMYLGKIPVDPKYDVDGSGKVDLNDVLGIQRAALGKDPKFVFSPNTFISPSTKTAADYAAEAKANQERILAQQKEDARRKQLFEDAKKISDQVTLDDVAKNPNLTAQQLANNAVVRYWSNESEAFSRVINAINNNPEKIKFVQGEDGLGITTGEHPGYDTLYLKPTAKENIYQFSTYNQRAGGTINGILFADEKTGKVAPIIDATKQIQYTPGQSGSFFGGLVGGIAGLVNDLGPLGQIGLAYLTGGLGSAIAEELLAQELVSEALANTVGDALAKTLIDVSQGKDLGESLTNSIIGAVVQTGTPDVANAISSVVDNKDIANVLTSAAVSAESTLLKGGDLQDALTNAVAAAAGTGAADVTDSSLTGSIVASLAAGNDLTTAITGAVTQMGINDAKQAGRDTTTVDKPIIDADTRGQDTVTTDTDTITGAGGEDVVTAADTVTGGVDTVTGVTGTDVIADDGTTQGIQDVIDTLTGATGLDLIQQTGQDTVTGGEATTQGAAGVDTITAGEDTITAAVDTITGGGDVADQQVIDLISGGEATTQGAVGDDVIADDGTTTGIQETIDTITGAGGEDTLVSGQDLSADLDTGANTLADIEQSLIAGGDLPSGQDLAADATAGNTLDDVSTVLTEDTTAEEEPTEEEPAVPEDKTTKPMVVSSKKGKAPEGTSFLLGTVLQQPSSLAQSLTSYRGAGELESKTTGKPRKNVWNEASLRLKDALGL